MKTRVMNSAIATMSAAFLFAAPAFADDGQKPKLRRHAATQQTVEAPAPMTKRVCDDPRPECEARPIEHAQSELKVNSPSSWRSFIDFPQGTSE